MASKTPAPAPDFTKMRKAKPPTMSAKTMKSIVSGATKVTSKLKMKGKVKDLDKDGDSKKDTDNDGM
jgi:hypothetical protein